MNTTKKENLVPSTSNPKEASELAKGADKSCGICLDVVLEKANPVERTFGILSSCCHCFCFRCIKTWRQSNFHMAKTCPECRVISEFVYPSKYWLENREEKAEFIEAEKAKEPPPPRPNRRPDIYGGLFPEIMLLLEDIALIEVVHVEVAEFWFTRRSARHLNRDAVDREG